MSPAAELRKDPLAFMRHYYLALDPEMFKPKQADTFRDGTVRLKLRDDTSDYDGDLTRSRNRSRAGGLLARFTGASTIKVTKKFTLRRASPFDDDAIPAYICPYEPGCTLRTTVGTAANLMFTAEMSGCTFGIGSPTPQGAVSVCHSNDHAAGSAGGAAGQAAAQLRSTMTALSRGGTAFQPGDYREVTDQYETRATVVGVRKGTTWEFWAQKFAFDNITMSQMKLVRIG